MERIRLDLMKEAEAMPTEMDDELYEEIEAPKFVDFTVPDHSRQDDCSWFCARVGCDQTHEEVDPDALYRSFLLRVMAARSPNVQRRKALDRQATTLIPKCPQSAPAKSAKSRIVRLRTMTSVPEKMAKAKLQNHPISSLKSTPRQAKEQVQHRTSREALTEPGSRRCPTNRDGFRSVRHQKEPVAVVKHKIVAKVLFADTTKERHERTTPSKCNAAPVSEACSEMKKLKACGRTKNVPSRYLCISTTPKSSKRAEDSAKSLNRSEETRKITKLKSETSTKMCKPSELQETSHYSSNDKETDGKLGSQRVTANKVVEHLLPSMAVASAEECLKLESLQSAKVDSTSSNNSRTMENCKKDIGNKVPLPPDCSKPASEAQNVTASEAQNVTELDDKENASDSNRERVVHSNNKNHASEKSKSATSKNVPQKVLRPQSKSSTEPSDRGGKHTRTTNPRPFRFRVDERGILKEANQERKLQTSAQAQKETESIFRHREGIKAVVIKEKIAEKTQSRLLKVASSRQTLKDRSVTVLKKPPDSQIGKGNRKTASPAVTLKGTRPTTVPKEPYFHRIHLPKCCSKRAEV